VPIFINLLAIVTNVIPHSGHVVILHCTENSLWEILRIFRRPVVTRVFKVLH